MADTLLAIDTSGPVTAVALAVDGRVAGALERSGDGHAEALLGVIDDVLRQAGASLESVSALALTTGPGSFTGLRTALATVLGLAWERQLTVYGISNLVLPLLTDGVTAGHPILATVEALPGELFAAGLRITAGELCEISPVCLLRDGDLEALRRLVETETGEPVAVRKPPPPGTCSVEALCRAPALTLRGTGTAATPKVNDLVRAPTPPLIQVRNGGAGIDLLYGKGPNAKTLTERGKV